MAMCLCLLIVILNKLNMLNYLLQKDLDVIPCKNISHNAHENHLYINIDTHTELCH